MRLLLAAQIQVELAEKLTTLTILSVRSEWSVAVGVFHAGINRRGASLFHTLDFHVFGYGLY